MAKLSNLDTGEDITRYVNFNKTQDVNLVVQTSLDGTEYLTRFGEPVYHYKIEAYVDNEAKEMLMAAFDRLDLLEVDVRIGTFTGRIKELGNFDLQYYGWYKVDIVLAAVSEVMPR